MAKRLARAVGWVCLGARPASELEQVLGDVEQRGTSARAAWRVEWTLANSAVLRPLGLPSASQPPHCLARAIAARKAIPARLAPLLLHSLRRSRHALRSADALVARAQSLFDPLSHRPLLEELWRLLKPKRALDSHPSKSWQELGFQGSHPATDLRGTGLLGLDALLGFARYYGQQACDVVAEAVDGGPSWYPWALASINITWWCLGLVQQRRLQFFLLQDYTPSLDGPPHSASSSSCTLAPLGDDSNTQSNITHEDHRLRSFLVLQAQLVLLFHSYWRRLEPSPMVMEFEIHFKRFKRRVEWGIDKGLVGGPGVGWMVPSEGAQLWRDYV